MKTNDFRAPHDTMNEEKPADLKFDVSVIIPVHNCEKWLAEALDSVLEQKLPTDITVEVSVYNDGSTDATSAIVQTYQSKFANTRNISVTYSAGNQCGGVGHAKNCAVRQSTGRYLCFLDGDDIMLPNRIQKQLQAAKDNCNMTLIGCQFSRQPLDSTVRYTRWANSITSQQLYTQAFTSHGPTVVAPTWFCSRHLYDAVGGFNSSHQKGYPEDLEFFFRTLRLGAKILRVDEQLVIYRYHQNCASFSVSENTIWDLRIKEFQDRVLGQWTEFTIWNAGKQGKNFFQSLNKEHRAKTVAFCDVDPKKLKHGVYEHYDEQARKVTCRIPIIHFKGARPPVVVCVKLDQTNSQLENAIEQLDWKEGTDFYYLS